MSWYQQTHWRILVALALGLVYGVVAAIAGWGQFTADWIAPFGAIFLRLLLLIAVPLVLASLITGVASLSDLSKLSRIGGKTILIYVGTTLIALIIGLVIVNILQPGATVPDALRERLQETYPGRCRRAGASGRRRPGPGTAAAPGRRGARQHLRPPRRTTATSSTWCSSPSSSARH